MAQVNQVSHEIKAADLRIGNLLFFNDRLISITVNDIAMIELNEPDSNYRAVPITEERLLNLGLVGSSTEGIASFSEEVEEGNTYWWERKIKRSETTDGFNFCIVRWGENGEFTFSYQDLRVRIRHIHQIQNLHHSLTGTELELKAQ